MECNICMQRFDPTDRRPKVLPCGHSFCLKCLRKLENRKCPLDNKTFKPSPDKLVDNFSLLDACDGPAESTHARLWCRRCRGQARDECVEQEHPVTTLKKWRADHVESTVGMLEGHAGILDEFAQTVDAEAVSAEVAGFHQELQQWKARMAAASGRLRDAQDADQAGWERALRDAYNTTLGPSFSMIAHDLLDPTTVCSVTLRRGDGGEVRWEGEVLPAEDAGARLLLSRMKLSKNLDLPGRRLTLDRHDWEERSNELKNSEDFIARMEVGSKVVPSKEWNLKSCPDGPGTVTKRGPEEIVVKWLDCSHSRFGPAVMSRIRPVSLAPLKPQIGAQEGEHFLDVRTSISRSNLQSLWDLLSNGSLAQVRFLVGLPFSTFPPWSQKALEQVAPHLEGLQMVSPVIGHLEVVASMPHLHSLSVTGVTGKHLELVHKMASLRSLELHCNLDAPLPELTFSSVTPACSLQWLRCGVHPLSTALALACAHADTLQELQLVAASSEPYGCPDLVREVRHCGLGKLKRMVLLRQTVDGALCRHDKTTCRAQVEGLWNMFVQCNMNVVMICNECNSEEFQNLSV